MLIDLEKWQEILTTLKQHKLRTGLTAFGVFWGIFMLVILLGAGKGLENGATANFGEVSNVVFIWSAGRTQTAYGGLAQGRRITLKTEDVDRIKERVPEVEFAGGFNRLGGWGTEQYIIRGDNSGPFSVRGSHPNMAHLHSLEVTQGRFINPLDWEERRKIAIIGRGVQHVLFESWEDPIGQDINIHGVNFTVVGTFNSRSTGDNAADEEEAIYIPNRTLRHTFNQMGWIGNITLIPKPGVHAADVETKVRNLLHEHHRVHPSDRGVFGSWNMQDAYDRVQGLFTGIAVFSWVVAIGTILAGAIGVGNIMLIVVKERTREIGLRKALGATPASIVSMIVQESILITAVAGYCGLVAGVLLLEGLNALLVSAGVSGSIFAQPEIDFTTSMVAVGLLVLAGFLAALLPAVKAARVNPIVALQDE
ncbi:ABC transporter permease [Marinimicrobium sp. ABcell2]|uniref:ABC transporter permease n=1 Tax=Marinimicrobium sp. ABcell2 TaxID=3069751 RepID=UPI0027B0887F|nr:ABC transporter permease [Marinimicrobium sp. ABcell2]MDQ2078154.1 ABC transporter permease [Marinimicrobium sp. ABcell2]